MATSNLPNYREARSANNAIASLLVKGGQGDKIHNKKTYQALLVGSEMLKLTPSG